jgi:hypothetical protein
MKETQWPHLHLYDFDPGKLKVLVWDCWECGLKTHQSFLYEASPRTEGFTDMIEPLHFHLQ